MARSKLRTECSEFVKKWGQAPAGREYCQGSARVGRSQSPFFHKLSVYHSRKGVAGIAAGLCLAAGMLLLVAAPLQAGPLFVAGQLEDGKFVPTPDVKGPMYSVRYSTANVAVEEETVRVQVDESIAGPEKPTQVVGLIPLPEGVESKTVQVMLGMGGSKPAAACRVQGADGGKRLRRSTKQSPAAPRRRKSWRSAGRPAVLVPHLELQGNVQITVEFRQPVRQTQGVKWLACPTPAASWGRGAVERLAVK